jgi:putative transposase
VPKARLLIPAFEDKLLVPAGIREVADEIWLVSFMDYDLGFFDKEKGRVEPAPNPFAGDKVLTMSPV